MSGEEIRGEEPTTIDMMLADLASSLSPTKSLERIDTYGKYLFTLVTAFATLLTGFGFVADKSAPFTGGWIFVPLALLAVSLATAIWALTPRLDTVELSNLASVKDHFDSLVQQRGRLVNIAGVCFGLALLASPLGWLRRAPATASLRPAVSYRLTRTAEGITFAGKAEFPSLPAGAVVETTVAGLPATGAGEGVALFRDRSETAAAGALTVAAELPRVGAFTALMLRLDVRRDGTQLWRETVKIAL